MEDRAIGLDHLDSEVEKPMKAEFEGEQQSANLVKDEFDIEDVPVDGGPSFQT